MSRQAVLQYGSSMPSIVEVPGSLSDGQWSGLSQSVRARPLSVSVHTEALLPSVNSVASDAPTPKALEISAVKSHSYQRIRKRACYVVLAAVVLAVLIAAAVCVPLFIVKSNSSSSSSEIVLPIANLTLAQRPPVTIRIQNANSNWAWMDDVANAFNAAYAPTNGMFLPDLCSNTVPAADSRGMQVSVFQTISRYNESYQPIIYAPTKAQWVRWMAYVQSDAHRTRLYRWIPMMDRRPKCVCKRCASRAAWECGGLGQKRWDGQPRCQ